MPRAVCDGTEVPSRTAGHGVPVYISRRVRGANETEQAVPTTSWRVFRSEELRRVFPDV